MVTYPRIPEFRVVENEPAISVGLRAFAYCLEHPAFMLTGEQRESALHASLIAVTAPDLTLETRGKYQRVRLLLMSMRVPEVPSEPQKLNQDDSPQGGMRVKALPNGPIPSLGGRNA